jgi:hypothetical protein
MATKRQSAAANDLQELFYKLQAALMRQQMETLADNVDWLRRRASQILAVRVIKS